MMCSQTPPTALQVNFSWYSSPVIPLTPARIILAAGAKGYLVAVESRERLAPSHQTGGAGGLDRRRETAQQKVGRGTEDLYKVSLTDADGSRSEVSPAALAN